MRKTAINKIFILIIAVFVFNNTYSQSIVKQFFKLPCPEKRWVISHAFVAKKALAVSKEAKHISDSILQTKTLDTISYGGRLDAFRHAFWMGRLTQVIGEKKAESLGKAHEKGNYKYYKRHKKEDGELPDKVMGDMDLFNNKVGIRIALKNPNSTNNLIDIVLTEVKKGATMMIWKDSEGNYLDCGGAIIDIDLYKGKWDIPKCLTSSKLN